MAATLPLSIVKLNRIINKIDHVPIDPLAPLDQNRVEPIGKLRRDLIL
jgi:hypothetical protein